MAGVSNGRVRRDDRAIKRQLRGALAFPITPFTDQDDVNLQAVANQARFLAESDICAIVAPSGTGEFFALTADESQAIVRETIAAVDGRKPVIAAVGVGPKMAAELGRRAEADGAAAIMVMPPYYGRPDPEGLLAYYQTIAGATDLPMIPYARDAAAFTPTLVERLAEAVPSFVAFKDGRGDVRLFQQIREHVNAAVGPDRLTWLAGAGDDLVGAYFAAGADGFTSSLACFWPEASAELYRLASTGDFAGLAEYHARVVQPIYVLRQRRPGFEVSVMKAAMEILGHQAGPARPPLANLTDQDRADLERVLSALDIPTAADRRAVMVNPYTHR